MTKYLVSFITVLLICTSPCFAAPPDDADAVIIHLEFLGYNIKKSEKNIIAKHPQNLNVVIKKYRGGMLFTSYIGANENGKQNTTSVLPLINMLNKKAAASRFYLDKDNDMVIESYYPGAYNKQAFKVFMNSIFADQKQLTGLGTILETYFD